MTLSNGTSLHLAVKPKCNCSAANSSNSKSSGTAFSSGKLVEFKKAALRRGTWFRTLSRIERGIIDLTVKYVDNIRSAKLAKVVTAIVQKLQTAFESATDRLVRTIGLPLARKISDIAVRLGNLSAASWAEDLAFARYLTLSSPKYERRF